MRLATKLSGALQIWRDCLGHIGTGDVASQCELSGSLDQLVATLSGHRK